MFKFVTGSKYLACIHIEGVPVKHLIIKDEKKWLGIKSLELNEYTLLTC